MDRQAAATALDSAERDRLPIDPLTRTWAHMDVVDPFEMAGGLTEAQPLQPGTQLDATFARLGRVGLRAIALPEVRMSWDQSL